MQLEERRAASSLLLQEGFDPRGRAPVVVAGQQVSHKPGSRILMVSHRRTTRSFHRRRSGSSRPGGHLFLASPIANYNCRKDTCSFETPVPGQSGETEGSRLKRVGKKSTAVGIIESRFGREAESQHDTSEASGRCGDGCGEVSQSQRPSVVKKAAGKNVLIHLRFAESAKSYRIETLLAEIAWDLVFTDAKIEPTDEQAQPAPDHFPGCTGDACWLWRDVGAGEEADTGQHSVDEKDRHSTTESAQQGKTGLRRLSAAGSGQTAAPQMNSAEKPSKDNACPA